MGWDPVWERIFQEHEWGKYPSESLIRFIAKNFYNTCRKDIKILEVGCGVGANIWYMAREGFNVYGIDGSASAINKAEIFLEAEKLKADLKTGDAAMLPYDGSYFDAVIDIECLYSNSRADAEKILAEIKRVLKNEGLFYSRTIADDICIGRSRKKIAEMEYTDVSDGPLAGRGLARLSTREQCRELYGKFLTVMSIDSLVTTFNNGSVKVSEWNIICRKQGA